MHTAYLVILCILVTFIFSTPSMLLLPLLLAVQCQMNLTAKTMVCTGDKGKVITSVLAGVLQTHI